MTISALAQPQVQSRPQQPVTPLAQQSLCEQGQLSAQARSNVLVALGAGW